MQPTRSIAHARSIAYATDGEEHCSLSLSWRVSAEGRLAEWYGLLTMPTVGMEIDGPQGLSTFEGEFISWCLRLNPLIGERKQLNATGDTGTSRMTRFGERRTCCLSNPLIGERFIMGDRGSKG